MLLASVIAGIALPIALVSSSVIAARDQDQMQSSEDAPGSCLRSCHPQRPACPGNMDPYQLGTCWSCCLRQRSRPRGARLSSPAVPELDLDRDEFEDWNWDLV
ncbi:hypothetical protein BDW74DRAFT_146275 [Aspergillus multicolor]|uniref:uncharacterized protein n=1 Tax=Aspergillus multicolor TaxID=41759 RepID=UPI003CCCCB94